MLYLENNKILSEVQHRFRKGKSTFTALKAVKEYIMKYRNDNRVVCMISMDIQNAFGSIHKHDLLSLMMEYDLPDKIIKFVSDYLSNRKVIVSDHDYVNNNIGVPQGSSLG